MSTHAALRPGDQVTNCFALTNLWDSNSNHVAMLEVGECLMVVACQLSRSTWPYAGHQPWKDPVMVYYHPKQMMCYIEREYVEVLGDDT